jgi:hypothetical protein
MWYHYVRPLWYQFTMGTSSPNTIARNECLPPNGWMTVVATLHYGHFLEVLRALLRTHHNNRLATYGQLLYLLNNFYQV